MSLTLEQIEEIERRREQFNLHAEQQFVALTLVERDMLVHLARLGQRCEAEQHAALVEIGRAAVEYLGTASEVSPQQVAANYYALGDLVRHYLAAEAGRKS